MKSAYFLPLGGGSKPGLAEVDLWQMEAGSYVVSRVIVSAEYRGQGYARQLMQEVLRDADAAGVTLLLEINPYGDMTYEQLESWYMRLGFCKDGSGVYRREANTGVNV